MTLTAKISNQDRIICSLDFENSLIIKNNYPKGSLRCPECHSTLFPRSRKGYVNHFVHSFQSVCSLGGESLAHQTAKAYIYKQCKKVIEDLSLDAVVELEFPIFKNEKLIRRADVITLFKNGYSIAFEVQLSPISLIEIQRRTFDYHEQGIDVQWFVTDKSANVEVKRFLLDQGVLCEFDVSEKDYLQKWKDGDFSIFMW